MNKQKQEIQDIKEQVSKINSQLIEQDHRAFRVLKHFLFDRRKLHKNHPDRKASAKALFWLVFSSRTILTASVSIVAILGVYFAYKANELLEIQNKKIDIQNQLSESQRRSVMLPELIKLIDDVNLISPNEDNTIEIPDKLINKLVILSNTFKPYSYVENEYDSVRSNTKNLNILNLKANRDSFEPRNSISKNTNEIRLIPNALSPERGIIVIILMNHNIKNIQKIIDSGINLTFADLSGVTLKGENLRKFNLSHSSFKGATLTDIDLSFTNLNSTNFENSVLKNIKFNNSRLIESSFENADLDNIDFSEAKAINVNFKFSILRNIKYNRLTNFAKSDITKASLGFHPTKTALQKDIRMIEKISTDQNYIVVGEIGSNRKEWIIKASDMKYIIDDQENYNLIIHDKNDIQ